MGDDDLVGHHLDGTDLVRQHLDRPYLELRGVDRLGLDGPHVVGQYVVGADLERQLLGLANLAMSRQ